MSLQVRVFFNTYQHHCAYVEEFLDKLPEGITRITISTIHSYGMPCISGYIADVPYQQHTALTARRASKIKDVICLKTYNTFWFNTALLCYMPNLTSLVMLEPWSEILEKSDQEKLLSWASSVSLSHLVMNKVECQADISWFSTSKASIINGLLFGTWDLSELKAHHKRTCLQWLELDA